MEDKKQNLKPFIEPSKVDEIKPLNEEKPVKDATFNTEDDLQWVKTELSKSMKVKQPLASAPTYDPKNFFEQVAFYNNKPYFNINNTWYTQTDGQYASLEIQRLSGATGNLTVSCGFRPKMIEIIATGDSLNTGTSHGVWSTGIAYGSCIYDRFSTPNWDTGKASTYILVVYKADGSQSYGSISSVSEDGFVLNFGAVAETLELIWKAYA